MIPSVQRDLLIDFTKRAHYKMAPPLDLHGYQTLLLIMYVHPGLRHATGAPLGWEGPLNHSFPGERCTGEGEFIAQVTLGGSLQNSLLSGGNSRRQGHKSWVAELSLSWQRKKYTKKKKNTQVLPRLERRSRLCS